MIPVFLDTVGLIALWDTDDQWHAAAESAYKRIVSQRQSTVREYRGAPNFSE